MILLFFAACSGGPSDSANPDASEECGDLDGAGTDTGNLPNVLGSWTSTLNVTDDLDGCAAENLGPGTEDWVGAFTMDGRVPDALYIEFLNAEERYWGAMDRNGGVTFTGEHVHSAGTLYVQLGGLVYRDQGLDRDVIDGAAFMGLDADGDKVIDCPVKGAWKAIKSGL
jgi:hypothetical protein